MRLSTTTCTRLPDALPARGRAGAATAALLALALLAGCASGNDPAAAGGSSGSPPDFPVTVTNCGVTTTFQQPPQRVVTMNQSATEIMLALGLQDRMVATTYAARDEILPRYRDEFSRIPVLAPDGYPTYEALLAEGPDFVYAGLRSAFSGEQGRSRERLRQAGIKTHLNPGYCVDGQITMQTLWDYLRTIGTIFGVPERAEQLVTDLQARLSRVDTALDGVQPVSVFGYDSGTQTPFAVGGGGMGNVIIERAGGRNIFAGFDDEFGDVSWEQVVQRQPTVILIMDYGDKSARQKRQFLLDKALLDGVPAIEQRRFTVLPLDVTFTGIRAPGAVVELARRLHPRALQ